MQWQERIVKLRSKVSLLLQLRHRVLLHVRQQLLRARLLDVLYQLRLLRHPRLVVTQLSNAEHSKNPESHRILREHQTHILRQKLRCKKESLLFNHVQKKSVSHLLVHVLQMVVTRLRNNLVLFSSLAVATSQKRGVKLALKVKLDKMP